MTPDPAGLDCIDGLLDGSLSMIAGRGYSLLPAMAPEEWNALVCRLGDVLDTARVELKPAARTYLSRPEEVPMHSDHPDADWIAWRCERPDPHGTPQLLCDSLALVDSLDEGTRRVLMSARVHARYRSGMPARPFPILSEASDGWRLFFAPWLEPDSTHGGVLGAWRRLTEAVESSRGSFTKVQLRAGEGLIIDNGRMLHGRPPLISGSPRLLFRTWLRLRHGGRPEPHFKPRCRTAPVVTPE